MFTIKCYEAEVQYFPTESVLIVFGEAYYLDRKRMISAKAYQSQTGFIITPKTPLASDIAMRCTSVEVTFGRGFIYLAPLPGGNPGYVEFLKPHSDRLIPSKPWTRVEEYPALEVKEPLAVAVLG